MKNKINVIDYLKTKAEKDMIFRVFLYSTLVFIPLVIVLEAIVLIAKPSSFPLMAGTVSLYANICLYLFLLTAFRKAGVKLDKKSVAITLLSVSVSILIFLYSMVIRKFLYFWDYTCYYSLTLNTIKEYSGGFVRGSGFVWVSSVWDYSWFIALITSFDFLLTNQSADSYCFSLAFSVIIPFSFALSGLILKIANIKKLGRTKAYIALLIGLLTILNVPALIFNIYRSMPDLFGMTFAAVLMMLLSDYRFEENDVERNFYLWGATVLIVYARRWYAFFAVSFWLAIAIYIVLESALKKNIKQIKNLIVFGIASVVGALLFLSPMVYRFLGKDYVSDYASWKGDTVLANFLTYYKHLGVIIVLVVLIGFIVNLFDKKLRYISLAGAICFFLPLFLFHIIQTADYHQLLILAPSMTLGIVLFIASVLSLNNKAISAVALIVLSLTSLLNIVGAFKDTLRPKSILFSNTSLQLPYRNDLEQIDYINSWIKTHSAEYGDIYMIPHNGTYCPDIFRWRAMPDRTIMDILPYGSDVTSAHEFPALIFNARYVITSDIKPIGEYNGSNADLINRVVSKLTEEGYYKTIETVDMKNGCNIIILERIKASDSHELELYRAAFKENIEKYPHLYEALI